MTEHRLFDVILSYQTQHEVTIQIQALDVHEAERKALSTSGLKLLPWTLKQPPETFCICLYSYDKVNSLTMLYATWG